MKVYLYISLLLYAFAESHEPIAAKLNKRALPQYRWKSGSGVVNRNTHRVQVATMSSVQRLVERS